MKRLAIIIVVLIVLISFIGFERIGRGLRLLVPVDQTAGARENGPASSAEVIRTTTSVAGGLRSSNTDSRSDDRDSTDVISAVPINDKCASRSLAVRITDEIAAMYFIKASTIIGHSEPKKEEVDRLREALAVIGDALRPSAVIFDAESFSTSETPVLLFARDEFDLTTQVKAIYDQLEKISNHPANEDCKVEQAASEQPLPAAQFR